MATGQAIGTLCVIDVKPRQIDHIELAILSTLRDLVVQELNQSTQELPHA